MRISTLARCWCLGAAFAPAGAAGTARGQAAAPPECLELESRALARPGGQQLQLKQAARATEGRLRWRSPDRITTGGRWRWQHDTLYLDVESTQRLPGARGALDPRGTRFQAVLVPAGGAWTGAGHQDVPGVSRGDVAAVRGQACGAR